MCMCLCVCFGVGGPVLGGMSVCICAGLCVCVSKLAAGAVPEGMCVRAAGAVCGMFVVTAGVAVSVHVRGMYLCGVWDIYAWSCGWCCCAHTFMIVPGAAKGEPTFC